MHAAFLYYDLRQAIGFEEGEQSTTGNDGFRIFLVLAEGAANLTGRSSKAHCLL